MTSSMREFRQSQRRRQQALSATSSDEASEKDDGQAPMRGKLRRGKRRRGRASSSVQGSPTPPTTKMTSIPLRVQHRSSDRFFDDAAVAAIMPVVVSCRPTILGLGVSILTKTLSFAAAFSDFGDPISLLVCLAFFFAKLVDEKVVKHNYSDEALKETIIFSARAATPSSAPAPGPPPRCCHGSHRELGELPSHAEVSSESNTHSFRKKKKKGRGEGDRRGEGEEEKGKLSAPVPRRRAASPFIGSCRRCRSPTSRHRKSMTKRERAARRSGSRHPVAVVVFAAPPSAMGEAEESVRKERDRRESMRAGREKSVLSSSSQRTPTATAPRLAATAAPLLQIVPRLGFVPAVNWVARRSRTKQRETRRRMTKATIAAIAVAGVVGCHRDHH
ncbi:hypothetical protein Ahy_B09g094667 [Arachis hypogaea]|uniref:Uncharacterized protein n=1 Tax=Arachis hypogaea TaxID=3818 RepID=A0A444XCI1_ARAHY|nr:hypothetical protein Ahy_B09g094667 [Arachis hypogaea]